MKNKKGNVVVIAIIIAIVLITIGVIGWLIARQGQMPVAQPVVTQLFEPVSQTQRVAQSTTLVSQQSPVDKIDSGWNNFSFSNISFKYPAQVCTDSTNCQSIEVIKTGDAINIGQYFDSNESLLTIYYVENIDQKGAEEYLQDKYGKVNSVSWMVDKNNIDIKLANHFGGFNRVSGGVISYAAYSEKLKTLVSFGYAPACIIDCAIDDDFLNSIKLNGIKVYTK